jgi:hypothetical protein
LIELTLISLPATTQDASKTIQNSPKTTQNATKTIQNGQKGVDRPTDRQTNKLSVLQFYDFGAKFSHISKFVKLQYLGFL